MPFLLIIILTVCAIHISFHIVDFQPIWLRNAPPPVTPGKHQGCFHMENGSVIGTVRILLSGVIKKKFNKQHAGFLFEVGVLYLKVFDLETHCIGISNCAGECLLYFVIEQAKYIVLIHNFSKVIRTQCCAH